MRRPRVVVFFGGESANNDLSSQTGHWVCQYLPRSQYDVTPVEILPDGKWKVPLGNLPRSGAVDVTLQRLSEAVTPLEPSEALHRLIDKPVDSLFTVVRGRGGDDGSLHSLGNLIGAGVAGSQYSTCQQTSDKHIFSQAISNVATAPYTRKFSRRNPVDAIVQEIQEDFLVPVYVKPASQEGSFGIEKIENPADLRAAATRILKFDDLLVQEGVPGTEISVSVTEDNRGHIHVLPATVIVPQRSAFYDQMAKRVSGRVALHTTHDKDNHILREAQTIARDVYDELNCNGPVTIDMIANGDDISVLEANVVPTFSEFTPLKHQLKSAGLHPSTLFSHLVTQSFERGRA